MKKYWLTKDGVDIKQYTADSTKEAEQKFLSDKDIQKNEGDTYRLWEVLEESRYTDGLSGFTRKEVGGYAFSRGNNSNF